MIQSFDEFNSEEINEKRMFTLSEIRKKASETLKSLGIQIPSEEEIKDMMDQLKKFITDHQMGIIQENNDNLEKSYSAGSKFGITKDLDAVFRPDWLVYTRKEIANTILEDAYEEEYDELITDEKILEFAQMLSDEDCERFVESQAEAFRHFADGDEIRDHFIQRSKDVLDEKGFEL